MPTLRGSNIAYFNTAASATINLPAGSAVGDFCILIAEQISFDAEAPWEPFGFKLVDFNNGASARGFIFKGILHADHVASGFLPVTFKGASSGLLALAVFTGPLADVRTVAQTHNFPSSGTASATTDGTPVSGDYALYFSAARYNGTTTSSAGTGLQTTTNSDQSGVLTGGALGASGAVSSTFTFSATPFGDYEAIVVVKAVAANLQLTAPLIVMEPLSDSVRNLRGALVVTEPLSDSVRNLRDALLVTEPLSDSVRNLRCPIFCIEALFPIPPEGTVSTELFPGSLGSPVTLLGLQWPIVKRPTWSTAMYRGATGVSVRRANMQYPIWEFELSFEFLRDNVNSEFQTLLDFFLARQGGFDTFLFKDKDDYQVTNGVLGTSDGVTTQFAFMRTFSTFYEKVGQVDNGNPIVIYHTPLNEAHTIPNAGPYTITINHPQATSPTITEDLGVKFTIGGTSLVKVGSSPAAGQYSVNLATGVYTFNSADANKGVQITYRYVALASNYTITLPNHVVFTTAPTTGTISGDFQFFFNCRFQEDSADFSKFAMTFWELQKVVLETVPQ